MLALLGHTCRRSIPAQQADAERARFGGGGSGRGRQRTLLLLLPLSVELWRRFRPHFAIEQDRALKHVAGRRHAQHRSGSTLSPPSVDPATCVPPTVCSSARSSRAARGRADLRRPVNRRATSRSHQRLPAPIGSQAAGELEAHRIDVADCETTAWGTGERRSVKKVAIVRGVRRE